MAAGAFGFSLTVMPQHVGYKGQPLACRLAASRDELRSYAGVLREAGHGVVDRADQAAQRPFRRRIWAAQPALTRKRTSGNLAQFTATAMTRPKHGVKRSTKPRHSRASAAVLKSPRVPLIIEFNLRNPFLFGSMNSIKPAFGDKSVEELKKFYARHGVPPHVWRRLGRRCTVMRDIWDRAKI